MPRPVETHPSGQPEPVPVSKQEPDGDVEVQVLPHSAQGPPAAVAKEEPHADVEVQVVPMDTRGLDAGPQSSAWRASLDPPGLPGTTETPPGVFERKVSTTTGGDVSNNLGTVAPSSSFLKTSLTTSFGKQKKGPNRPPDQKVTLDYRNLPPDVQRVISLWDTDHSGTVDIDELEAASRAEAELQNRAKIYRRVAIGALTLCLIFGCMVFCLSYASMELAKEVHLGGGQVMRTSAGLVVQMSSSEMMVQPNGELTVRLAPDQSRRLQEQCEAGGGTDCANVQGPILKTTEAKKFAPVTISLNQEQLSTLLGVQIKGSTQAGVEASVYLEVVSTTRQVAQGSSCGYYHIVRMTEGSFVLDGEQLYVDTGLAEVLVSEGLLPDSTVVSAPVRIGDASALQLLGTFGSEFQTSGEMPECGMMPQAPVPTGPHYFYDATLHYSLPGGSSLEVLQKFVKKDGQVIIVSTTATQTRVERWDLEHRLLTTSVISGNDRVYCHDTPWGDEVLSTIESGTSFITLPNAPINWTFVGTTMKNFPKLLLVFQLQGLGPVVRLVTDANLQPASARVLPANPEQLDLGVSPFAEVTFKAGSFRFNATMEEAQDRLAQLGLDLFAGCGQLSEGNVDNPTWTEEDTFAGLVPDSGMRWVARENPLSGPQPVAPPISFSDPSLIQGCFSTCYSATLGAGEEVGVLRSCFGAWDDDGICDVSQLEISARLLEEQIPDPAMGFDWEGVKVTVESPIASVQLPPGRPPVWPQMQDWEMEVPLQELASLGSKVRLPAHSLRYGSMILGNPPRLQGEATSVTGAQLVPDAGEEVRVIAVHHLGLGAPLCVAEAEAGSLPAHCQSNTVELREQTHVLAPASWMAFFTLLDERTLARGSWSSAASQRSVPEGPSDSENQQRRRLQEESEGVPQTMTNLHLHEEEDPSRYRHREKTRRLSEYDPDLEPESIAQTSEFFAARQAVLSTLAAYESAAEDPLACWSSTATECATTCAVTDLDFIACEDAEDMTRCAGFEYCPHITEILTGTDDWTDRSALYTTLTAATAASFPRILREAATLLKGWIDAQPDISTWTELEPPDDLKLLLQNANSETLTGVKMGVAVSMVELAQHLVMQKETSNRVPKRFKWESLEKSAELAGSSGGVITSSLINELMMMTLGSGDEAGEEAATYLMLDNVAHQKISFESDLASDPQDLTLAFKNPDVTLQFPGTNFKLRVQAESLSITHSFEEGTGPVETLQDEVRKLAFDDMEVIVLPMSVGSEEADDPPQGGDEWKVPFEGEKVPLSRVLGADHGLPSWVPLEEMNVQAFTWDMSAKSLILTCYGQFEPEESPIDLLVILATVTFKESLPPEFSVDWINVTMTINGVTGLMANAVDDTGLAALPSMTMVVSGSDNVAFVSAVANRSMELMGVTRPIVRHSRIGQANIKIDVTTFALLEASLSNALFYLYDGLYELDLSADDAESSRANDAFEPKVPILSFFTLPFVIGNNELVALGRPEQAELLDLFVAGFHFAFEESAFEGAGPETVFEGSLIQDPTTEVLTTLSAHLQRILCHENKEAYVNLEHATVRLAAASFHVVLTLHQMSWAIAPQGTFPMIGNVTMLVDTLTLSLNSSLILDDLPTVSSFGGDPRMRFLTPAAAGVSVGFPRLSDLDNLTLWQTPLEPNSFSGCNWKQLAFTGDMMGILDGSETLRSRLARVVFVHKQALQLTGEQPATSSCTEGASAEVTLRLSVPGEDAEEEEEEDGFMEFSLTVNGPCEFSSGGARRLKDWVAMRRLQELTEQDGIPRRLSATVPADQEAKDSFVANEGVTIAGGLEFPKGVLADWMNKLHVTGAGVEPLEYRRLREAADPRNHEVARRLAQLAEQTCDLPARSSIEDEPEELYTCQDSGEGLTMPSLPGEGRELLANASNCEITVVVDLKADGFDPIAGLAAPLLKYALQFFGVPQSITNTITSGLSMSVITDSIPVVVDMLGGDFQTEKITLLLTTLGLEGDLNKYINMFAEGALTWAGLPKGAAKTIVRRVSSADMTSALGLVSQVMMAPSSSLLPALQAFQLVDGVVELFAAPVLVGALEGLGLPPSSAEQVAYGASTVVDCLKAKTDSLAKIEGFLGELKGLSQLKTSNFRAVCGLAELMCVGPQSLGSTLLDPLVRGRLASLSVPGETIAEVVPGLITQLEEACGENPSGAAAQLGETVYTLLVGSVTERTQLDTALTSLLDSQSVALPSTADFKRLLSTFRKLGIPTNELIGYKDRNLAEAPRSYQDVAALSGLWDKFQADATSELVSPLLRSVCDVIGLDPSVTYQLQQDFAVKARTRTKKTFVPVMLTDISQIIATISGELSSDICPVLQHLLQTMQSETTFLGPIMGSAMKNTFKAFRMPATITDDAALFFSDRSNAADFMNTPSCNAIFSRTASLADLQAAVSAMGLTAFDPTAHLQSMVYKSLLSFGATTSQADALSKKADQQKMELIGSNLMPLLSGLGQPEEVGMAICDVVTLLDPEDGTHTPVGAIQQIIASKLTSTGFPTAVTSLITDASSKVAPGDGLRLVCAEFVGPLVTSNMDLVRLHAVVERLAPSLLGQVDNVVSEILGGALRSVGVDLTDAQVLGVLEDPPKRQLLQQMSWKVMRGHVDVGLALRLMDELALDPVTKFLQPSYEAGMQKICMSEVAKQAGFTVQSTAKADIIGLLHEDSLDVKTLLNYVSEAIGQTTADMKTSLLKPCFAGILEAAGLSSGAQELVEKLFKKPVMEDKHELFLTGLLARRVDSELIRAVGTGVALGSISESQMALFASASEDGGGVPKVMRRGRERWTTEAELPRLGLPVPGKARPAVSDPMTLCAKVVPPELDFFDGFSPSPLEASLRFRKDFSEWEVNTGTISFKLGGPLPAELSARLHVSNLGLNILGSGSITESTVAAFVPQEIASVFGAFGATAKVELQVPFGGSGSSTLEAYGLVNLDPNKLSGDVFKVQGNGQILVGMSGPLSDLSFSLLGAHGCLEASVGSLGLASVEATAVIRLEESGDKKVLELRAAADFSLDLPDAIGVDLVIPLRLKHTFHDGAFAAVGRLEFTWNVPGTDMEVQTKARATIERGSKDASTVWSFYVLGCEPNFRLPFPLLPNLEPPTGSIRAFLDFRKEASGTSQLAWEVSGSLTPNLGSVIKNALLELNVSSEAGLVIRGAAQVEIPFPGDIGKITAPVEAEYSSRTGFRCHATVAIPLTPASWGINPAMATIIFENNRLQVEAELYDTLDLRSLIPSQGIINTVDLRASISYPGGDLQMAASATFTLPSWLGSKEMLLVVHLSPSGLTIYGRLEIGVVLFPLEAVIGEDLRLEGVEVIALAPFKKKQKIRSSGADTRQPSSPSASLVVEASLGAYFHGVAGFETDICAAFLMTKTPVWLATILGKLDVAITSGRALSISVCSKTGLFEYYSFVVEQLLEQNNKVLPKTAMDSLTNVQKVFDALPVRVRNGIHLTFPCMVEPGSMMDGFIKKVSFGTTNTAWEAFLNFDYITFTFRFGIGFPTFVLPKVGPLIEAYIQANVEAVWVVGSAPVAGIVGTMGVTIKIMKDNYIKLVGSIAVGGMIEAYLELIKPTVLPLLSPRLVLVRTFTFPTYALVRLTASSQLWVELSGGILVDTLKFWSLKSGVTDGVDALTECNRRDTCFSYQVSAIVDIEIAALTVRSFYIRARMAPAHLSEYELMAAIVGIPLPMGAITFAKSLLAPLPVICALEAAVGVSGFRLAIAMATTWSAFQSDMMMTSEFDMIPGKMPNIAFSFAANAFCLGLPIKNWCFGLRVDKTELGEEVYGKSKAAFARIWNEGWADQLLPSKLRNGNNIGPAMNFQLQPVPELQMALKAQFEAGPLDLSVLGAVDLVVSMSPKEIFIQASLVFRGVRFSVWLDMRMGLSPKENKLRRFDVMIDFYLLIKFIKDVARTLLGSWLYKIASALGVFSSIRVDHGLFSINGQHVRLQLKMKIFWSISLNVKINYVQAANIIAGKFWELAKLVFQKLKSLVMKINPCSCKTPWYTRWEQSLAWKKGSVTVPTWGLCWKSKCISWPHLHVGWKGRRRWAGKMKKKWHRHRSCIKLPTSGKLTTYFPYIGMKWSYRRRKCDTVVPFCPMNPFNPRKFKLEKWRFQNPLDGLLFVGLPPSNYFGVKHVCNR